MKLRTIFAFISSCILAAHATLFSFPLLQESLKASKTLETRELLISGAALLSSQILNGAVTRLPPDSFLGILARRLFQSEDSLDALVFKGKDSTLPSEFLACAVLFVRSARPSFANFFGISVKHTLPSSFDTSKFIPYSVARKENGLPPEISMDEFRSGKFLEFLEEHYPHNPDITNHQVEFVRILIKAMEEISLRRDKAEMTLFLEHLIFAFFLKYSKLGSQFVAIIESAPYHQTGDGNFGSLFHPISLQYVSFYMPTPAYVKPRSKASSKIQSAFFSTLADLLGIIHWNPTAGKFMSVRNVFIFPASGKFKSLTKFRSGIRFSVILQDFLTKYWEFMQTQYIVDDEAIKLPELSQFIFDTLFKVLREQMGIYMSDGLLVLPFNDQRFPTSVKINRVPQENEESIVYSIVVNYHEFPSAEYSLSIFNGVARLEFVNIVDPVLLAQMPRLMSLYIRTSPYYSTQALVEPTCDLEYLAASPQTIYEHSLLQPELFYRNKFLINLVAHVYTKSKLYFSTKLDSEEKAIAQFRLVYLSLVQTSSISSKSLVSLMKSMLDYYSLELSAKAFKIVNLNQIVDLRFCDDVRALFKSHLSVSSLLEQENFIISYFPQFKSCQRVIREDAKKRLFEHASIKNSDLDQGEALNISALASMAQLKSQSAEEYLAYLKLQPEFINFDVANLKSFSIAMTIYSIYKPKITFIDFKCSQFLLQFVKESSLEDLFKFAQDASLFFLSQKGKSFLKELTKSKQDFYNDVLVMIALKSVVSTEEFDFDFKDKSNLVFIDGVAKYVIRYFSFPRLRLKGPVSFPTGSLGGKTLIYDYDATGSGGYQMQNFVHPRPNIIINRPLCLGNFLEEIKNQRFENLQVTLNSFDKETGDSSSTKSFFIKELVVNLPDYVDKQFFDFVKMLLTEKRIKQLSLILSKENMENFKQEIAEINAFATQNGIFLAVN